MSTPQFGSRPIEDTATVGLSAAMAAGKVIAGSSVTAKPGALATQPSFNSIPSLPTLLGNTGVIGPTYTHVMLDELPRAEREGYSRIPLAPLYQVCGKWCALVAIGTATPGGRTSAQISNVKASKALLAHVEQATRKPMPPAPAPLSEQKHQHKK